MDIEHSKAFAVSGGVQCPGKSSFPEFYVASSTALFDKMNENAQHSPRAAQTDSQRSLNSSAVKMRSGSNDVRCRQNQWVVCWVTVSMHRLPAVSALNERKQQLHWFCRGICPESRQYDFHFPIVLHGYLFLWGYLISLPFTAGQLRYKRVVGVRKVDRCQA